MSVNIYSHLIGAIAFFKTGVSFYTELCARYPSCNSADIYVFTIFLLSAATCFILSAVCHLILNHSHSSARLGTTLDYLGIIVFIVGTCVSGFYYGLREHESLLHLYWTMVRVTLQRRLCPKVRLIETGIDRRSWHTVYLWCCESRLSHPALATDKGGYFYRSWTLLYNSHITRNIYIRICNSGEDDGATVDLCPGSFVYPRMCDICFASTGAMVSWNI